VTDQLPFSETIANAPPAQDRPGFVRLCKDFLHADEYVIGFEADGSQIKRRFTPADFSAIVARFAELNAAGIPTPLRWGHGSGVGDTDDTQSEADVAEVWADNERAYFGVYVTPEDAARLTKKQRPCSPALEPNFMDGTGKVWPGYSLKHIAMVSHATVPDQLPFIQMGLPAPKPQGKRKMPVTFEPLVTNVNRLFDRVKPGAGLATEGDNAVTEDNFDVLFPAIVDAILGPDAEEPEPAADEPPVVEPAAEADPLVMSLKTAVESLTAEVAALRNGKAADAKAEFESAVDALCADGTIKAAKKPILMELAKGKGYDKQLLADLYDGAEKAILMGSKTKHLKNAKEPNAAPFSEADREKAKRLLGRKPKKAD